MKLRVSIKATQNQFYEKSKIQKNSNFQKSSKLQKTSFQKFSKNIKSSKIFKKLKIELNSKDLNLDLGLPSITFDLL